jgi:DNA mismatch endonuclease (patch repair protein)
MSDPRTPEQRRRIMQSVKTRDTGPERVVRQVLTRLGYRYQLNAKHLPGKPDITLPGKKKAIFVHGCFWHGHGCSKGRAPKSRLEYWGPKLGQNMRRDAAQIIALRELGWSVLTIWQCELYDREVLEWGLRAFIEAWEPPNG